MQLFSRPVPAEKRSAFMMTFTLLILLISALQSSPLVAQTSSLRSLRPWPKVAYERGGMVTLATSPIIVADPAFLADSVTARQTLFLLQSILRQRYGTEPNLVAPHDYDGESFALLLGRPGSPFIAPALAVTQPDGAPLPAETGLPEIARDAYILDISDRGILIAADDPAGIANGVATFAQLLPLSSPFNLPSCHIIDYPDYPLRWVFSQHNLRGNGAMTTLRGILDQMQSVHINGIQQGDFKYTILEEQPGFYFDSVARFATMAEERSIGIIPGVAPVGWSSGILWHDPHLAEGFPAEADYVMRGGSGQLIPDTRVQLPNGNFESLDGNGAFSGWGFYDTETITVDNSVAHSGSRSGLSSNFQNHPAGNSRFNRSMPCQPYRAYTMSVWVKTENLDADQVQLLAIGQDSTGKGRTLTFTAFSVSGTSNGWQRLEARFNTLEFTRLLLYCGVWGGRSGKVWWDDFMIEDAGLLNILRREGTPLHVIDRESGKERKEGIDFAEVRDPIMEQSHGEFGPFHTPPTIQAIGTGAIGDGDTLHVSWFHPLTTVADEQVNGSVMACPSEEEFYDIIRTELTGVEGLYHPGTWFMGHDEIRSLNRDSSCLRRGLSAAEILAENVVRIEGMIDSVHPGADIAVWSDMFDSLHNARADYYLINGDLSGDWDLIPKRTTIVNWNSGKRKQSLDFFIDHGFRQIVAPFISGGSINEIRAWRLAAEGKEGIRGMMYVTWSNDYSRLVPFGYYSWGAGPLVLHRPVNGEEWTRSLADDGAVRLEAEIAPDPYDNTDQIEKVEVVLHFVDAGEERKGMARGSGDIWSITMPSVELQGVSSYRIEAINRQGIRRATPDYRVEQGSSAVPGEPDRSPDQLNLSLRN